MGSGYVLVAADDRSNKTSAGDSSREGEVVGQKVTAIGGNGFPNQKRIGEFSWEAQEVPTPVNAAPARLSAVPWTRLCHVCKEPERT